MKLDSRIIDKSKIFTPLNTEGASEYIGQDGYFTDDYTKLTDVRKLNRSKLYDVHEEQTELVYTTAGSDGVWKFFIPASNIRHEKYIPFGAYNELEKQGIITGKVITFRNNNYPEVVSSAMVTEINYNPQSNEIVDITLGATVYEFGTLWVSYSIFKDGEWIPFGVLGSTI